MQFTADDEFENASVARSVSAGTILLPNSVVEVSHHMLEMSLSPLAFTHSFELRSLVSIRFLVPHVFLCYSHSNGLLNPDLPSAAGDSGSDFDLAAYFLACLSSMSQCACTRLSIAFTLSIYFLDDYGHCRFPPWLANNSPFLGHMSERSFITSIHN